jgi:Transposase
VARPEQVDVWIGLDVGKENHFAEILDDAGERIFARGVANDQAALEALFDRAGKHGTVGLVIDQPGSIAQLTLAVAARRQVPVAYVPGLVMRRACEVGSDGRVRGLRGRPAVAQAPAAAGRGGLGLAATWPHPPGGAGIRGASR